MAKALWMPPPEKDFDAAKRQYVELYGSVAVANTYLRIALVAVSVVCIGQAIVEWRMLESLRQRPPLVVRIDDVGRAQALQYADFKYQPQEREIKFFLIDFVQRHYGRIRATLTENYARSFYFLDGRLADSLVEANKKDKALETFLAGSGEEIDVEVKGVSIEDLRQPPYRATVDFEKVYYGPNRTVARRENYVGHFVFIVKDQVPNAMIPINPLGLTITYFREDQTFQ